MFKRCTKCKKKKLVVEFRYRNKTQGVLQTQCKSCCKKDGKKHYNANRHQQIKKQTKRNATNRQTLLAYKKTLKCSNCEESAWYCLDFHHIDGEKEFDISGIPHSLPKLAKELAKCVCLCSNCHRKAHAGDIEVNRDWILTPPW